MSALQAAFVSSLPLAWISASTSTNLVSEVPESRWTVSSSAPARVRYGGFAEGVERFDYDLFAVPKAEAACMDPQQRLL